MKILIKNAGIITGDVENMYIENGNIEIENGYITYIGTENRDEKGFEADKTIDCRNKIVMPGLVNAHTHSPMTILRNYADDLNLEDWLFNKIIPAEARLSPEDVYWGTMLGIAEMIKSGTTCFADMYLHIDEVAKAVMESGIRASISKGPLVSGFRGQSGISVDEKGCTEYFKNWNNKANGRIKTCIEIHSVYLYDEKSLRGAASLAKELDTRIHIHILETRGEVESSMSKYGKSSVEACLEFGIFDVPVIAAHCVHINDKDLRILRERNINVVHNPSSNLKLGSGIARIPDMIAADVNTALGTDGAASNNNLNMFEEIHLAALLHKGVNMDPTLVNTEQVLRMATVNGAKALGFGHEVGVLKEGMKADIILIDTDKPHLYPMNNPMSAVVYSAQASDIDTVIIDGNVVMENRKLTTIDEELIKYKASEISKKVLNK